MKLYRKARKSSVKMLPRIYTSEKESVGNEPTEILCADSNIDLQYNFYLNVFLRFFNFGYYLFVIPFRFILEEEDKIILKTSKLRKLAVIISWALSLKHHFLRQYSRIFVDSIHSNVLICFNFLHAVLHAVAFSTCYYQGLTNAGLYWEMMNIIKDCKFMRKFASDSRQKVTNFLQVVFHIVIMIGIPLMNVTAPAFDHNWDLSKTFKSSCSQGLQYFYANISEYIHCESAYGFTYLEVLVSVYPSIVSLSYFILVSFRLLTFLYPVMSLYTGVNGFIKEVMHENKGMCVDGMVKMTMRANFHNGFAQLQTLKKILNDTWSLAYFFVLIDHTLWLATDLTVGMKEIGYIRKFFVVYCFLGTVVLFVLASEVSRKMCVFKVWLMENWTCYFLDNTEYVNFRESLEENGIWIGKIGLYRFDYNFIGQMVVLVISLFVISLQSERV